MKWLRMILIGLISVVCAQSEVAAKVKSVVANPTTVVSPNAITIQQFKDAQIDAQTSECCSLISGANNALSEYLGYISSTEEDEIDAAYLESLLAALFESLAGIDAECSGLSEVQSNGTFADEVAESEFWIHSVSNLGGLVLQCSMIQANDLTEKNEIKQNTINNFRL